MQAVKKGGRDDADDADGAGGRGGRKGEDAGDPLATPSGAATALANTAPGCSKKRDLGRGSGSAEEGGLAESSSCSTEGAADSGVEGDGAGCRGEEVAGKAGLDAEAPEAAVRGGDAASAPEEGRSGAGDAADAGGGGEEKGEDAGDPRATPPTDANERAIGVRPVDDDRGVRSRGVRARTAPSCRRCAAVGTASS